MFVEVVDGVGAVRDAENLKALSVRVASVADIVDPALVREVGDGGRHVWLDIAELKARGAATVADAVTWGAGFDGMIAFAAQHGWVNEAGDTVRAHVESPT